jgi:hypothetical protein
VLQLLMLRPLWRMLQITPTAFRTPARAGSRYQLCSSFSSNLGYSIAFRSSSSEAGPAVSLLSALGSATVAAKQLKQPAFQASVAAFRQTPGSDRPISNTVAVAAARSSSSMQPQQQQYSHLLMSPEQQQQLLESVKDRPPVIFYHYPCTDGERSLHLLLGLVCCGHQRCLLQQGMIVHFPLADAA